MRVPPLVFRPDQLYRVPTEDGSAIALGRYFPRGPRRFVEPVILAHSLGTNRFNLDFDERYSFARGLARRGFETWVLEMRGHGLGGSAAGATFDTEVKFDVAAALSAVLSTGAPRVSWVGHSRGGLLAYAHLARFPAASISAVVTLGSPVSFQGQPGLQRFVQLMEPTLSLPTVPLRWAGKLWPLGLPPEPFGKYFGRADNMDPLVIRQAISYAAADVPGGVLRQFARWVRQGKFDSDDGFDYRRGMAAIHAPVLAIAGAVDAMVPMVSAHEVQKWVSGPVEIVEAGVREGFSTNYGHGDLVLGRKAPDEILPRLAEFLARNSTSHA